MKIPNSTGAPAPGALSLARIVSEDSQLYPSEPCKYFKSSKDS